MAFRRIGLTLAGQSPVFTLAGNGVNNNSTDFFAARSSRGQQFVSKAKAGRGFLPDSRGQR